MAFLNVPTSMTAGKTFTVTWQAVSKSISGDWIGLFVQNVYSASWWTNVATGSSGGSFSLAMPNNPGTEYNFIYVRGGYVNSVSSLILCTSTSSDASAVELISTHDSHEVSDTPVPTLTHNVKVASDTPVPTLTHNVKVASDTPVPTLTHYVKVASDTPVPTLTHNVKVASDTPVPTLTHNVNVAPEREVFTLEDTPLPTLTNMREIRTVAIPTGVQAKKSV